MDGWIREDGDNSGSCIIFPRELGGARGVIRLVSFASRQRLKT